MRVSLVTAMISALIICPTCIAETPSASLDWTQWRGPSRDGQIAGQKWPEALGEGHLQEVWRVELAPSYSGPIVAGQYVFVTETRDEEIEVVSALDRSNGEVRWEASWPGSLKVPAFARSNGSWIRSTPTYDDGRLYVGGIRDVLVCLDAATGDEIWRLDCVSELESKAPAFGMVCSPLVDGEFLYVQAAGGLLKLDKRTGEVIWKALEDGGGMFGSAFSSPYMQTLAGQKQILVQTREMLAGVDPDTGDELWVEEIEAFRGMNILTPTVYGDRVFTSSYGGRTLALEIGRDGGELTSKEVWTNKLQGYMSSPVIIGDFAYLHLRDQRFACVDMRSGEVQWKTKPFGKYWSMVANEDRILALDERGDLLLIQADPEEFKLVDSVPISDDETWAHLAIVGHEVFVRELNAMAMLRWE